MRNRSFYFYYFKASYGIFFGREVFERIQNEETISGMEVATTLGQNPKQVFKALETVGAIILLVLTILCGGISTIFANGVAVNSN